MKCSMNTVALKCWGRVVHTLTLIGDENIHIQFGHIGLILTAFNTASTIRAKVIFDREFFLNYEDAEDDEIYCTIPTKSLLKPFRSLRFLAKCTSTCELRYDCGSDHLKVALHCKFGGVIQYSIILATAPVVHQDDIDLDVLKNLINSRAKLIVTSLSNFSHGKGVSDLTIKASREQVFLKNCMTDLVKKDGKVYTELCVNSEDFTEFDIHDDCELTIDMKEFKIFASFAESMKLPIAIHFNTPQEPVVATARSDDYYYATLTLATKRLQDDGSSTIGTGPMVSISHVSSKKTAPTNSTKHNAAPPSLPYQPSKLSFKEVAKKTPINKNFQHVFPNLGTKFLPSRDIPGHDIMVLDSSDEEEV